jgi:O-antigen/teichoic acid export membrane protein
MTETPESVSTKDVAKGAGTTLLARLGAVLEVIAQPLYVLMFGLAGYGLYAVLWSAINLAENCLDMGMTAALQRVVPQAHSRDDEAKALRAAFILGIGPCLLAAATASLCAPWIAPLFNAAPADAARLSHTIALFAWALPLWAFIEISTSALRAKRVFGAEIRLRIFWEQVIRLLLATALFGLGFETMSLFYAHLVSLAVICGLCVRLLARHFDMRLVFRGHVTGPVFTETLKAGLAVLPVNLVARLFGDGPPLALNWLLPGASGAAAGGLYSIARKVSSLIQVVRMAFSYVLAPLASAATKGRAGEVRNIYAFATRVSFAIAVPAGIVLAAGGPSILRLFGNEAEVALPALVILVLMRVFEAVVGAAGPIQQVTGGYKSQLSGSVAGLAAAILLGVALMPEGALTGMALAVSLGVVVSTALPLAQLHLFQKLHPFETPFVRVAVRATLIALGGLGVALLITLLPHPAQLPLVLVVLLAALWCSARYALPLDDRLTLGKTGRALRLV